MTDTPLYRTDLLPGGGLLSAARVLAEGERKGLAGWADLPPEIHLSRALTRIQRYLSNPDDAEDDLAHVACRVLMACHIVSQRQETHDAETLWTVKIGLSDINRAL